MEEKEIKSIGLASLERAFGGHTQVGGEILGRPELRIGEPRKPLRTVPFSGVEIVTDGTDEAIRVPGEASEGDPEEGIGLPSSVNISG